MIKKNCPECGKPIEEDSDFCSNCGKKVENDNKDMSQNNLNIFNSLLSNSKLIIFAVGIIAVIGLIIISSGLFSGDLVDVTSTSLSVGYSDTPFGGALSSAAAMNGEDTNYRDYQVGTAVFKYSLMPRESITRITGMSLKNVEVSFDGGGSENWGDFYFKSYKTAYIQDLSYDFQITKTLKDTGENIDEYYAINHIKADIVINTTDETNKVIGHIDENIVPN